MAEMALGVENGDDAPAAGDGFSDQRAGQTPASLVRPRRNSPDSTSLRIIQDAETGQDAVVVPVPQMLGGRFEVSPVDLVVRACLFDHEDIDAEPEKIMEVGRRDLGSDRGVQTKTRPCSVHTGRE